MYEVRITPLALIDLEDIWYYTFREWSFEQANLYQSSIEFGFSRLAENPF
jgi:toxin ParE1/3/4